MSYIETAARFYEEVARNPIAGQCCAGATPLRLPGLVIPEKMLAMSYGCGSTLHPSDLGDAATVLYVGVGGGIEALQFAYFTRRPGGVIAVDPVAAMREAARANLDLAASMNGWFDQSYVVIREGTAFGLPVEDASVDLIAQNCLFNIFEPADLLRALREARRTLRPGGKLAMSDPIATGAIPAHLRGDERLRAMCLSGALTYAEYIASIVAAGFGEIAVCARRPYRVLDPSTYGLAEPLLLESIDIVAYNVPVPDDGPCVFSGRAAIYVGSEARLDDGLGHILERGVPFDICEKTAARLARRRDILITAPTWHHAGAACC